MDKFSMDKQGVLLKKLKEIHPHSLCDNDLPELYDIFGSEEKFISNACYLHDHGLIGKVVYPSLDGIPSINTGGLKITNKGIDYISNDGGLSSKLNVITVKMHNETIEKLTEIINNAPITTKEKESFISKLKDMPAEVIKHVMLETISKLINNVPDAYQILLSCFK